MPALHLRCNVVSLLVGGIVLSTLFAALLDTFNDVPVGSFPVIAMTPMGPEHEHKPNDGLIRDQMLSKLLKKKLFGLEPPVGGGGGEASEPPVSPLAGMRLYDHCQYRLLPAMGPAVRVLEVCEEPLTADEVAAAEAASSSGLLFGGVLPRSSTTPHRVTVRVFATPLAPLVQGKRVEPWVQRGEAEVRGVRLHGDVRVLHSDAVAEVISYGADVELTVSAMLIHAGWDALSVTTVPLRPHGVRSLSVSQGGVLAAVYAPDNAPFRLHNAETGELLATSIAQGVEQEEHVSVLHLHERRMLVASVAWRGAHVESLLSSYDADEEGAWRQTVWLRFNKHVRSALGRPQLTANTKGTTVLYAVYDSVVVVDVGKELASNKWLLPLTFTWITHMAVDETGTVAVVVDDGYLFVFHKVLVEGPDDVPLPEWEVVLQVEHPYELDDARLVDVSVTTIFGARMMICVYEGGVLASFDLSHR